MGDSQWGSTFGTGVGRQGYRRWGGCQALLLALLLGLVPGCGGKNQEAAKRDAQTSYKLGVAFLAEGRPAPALKELAKAESFTPDDPEIVNVLGLAYWARGETGLAEEKFRRATELKPDYSEAWNNLGALYIDEGRYYDAVPVLENALKNVFYQTQERALTNLGWALYKTDRTAEAEKRLRAAVEMAPGFPLARKNLGILLQDAGDHRAAVEQFDRAIRSYPDDAEVHLKRGLSLLRLGERTAAREAFDRAWHLAPGSDVGKTAKTYLDFLDQG